MLTDRGKFPILGNGACGAEARDVHTQGLELGEVVAERRELQARLPTMAVLAMATFATAIWLLTMATYYGYLLWLLTMTTYYGYLLWLLTMARATGAPRPRCPPEGQGRRPEGCRGAACSDQAARVEAGMGW